MLRRKGSNNTSKDRKEDKKRQKNSSKEENKCNKESKNFRKKDNNSSIKTPIMKKLIYAGS